MRETQETRADSGDSSTCLLVSDRPQFQIIGSAADSGQCNATLYCKRSRDGRNWHSGPPCRRPFDKRDGDYCPTHNSHRTLTAVPDPRDFVLPDNTNEPHPERAAAGTTKNSSYSADSLATQAFVDFHSRKKSAARCPKTVPQQEVKCQEKSTDHMDAEALMEQRELE